MEFDIEFFGKALLVTIPTTVVAFGFVVMHPGLPYADDTVDTFYPLTRKERRTLRKLEYVEVDERLARKVNTIMGRSVDTSQLRQPYDDYINLLVFLHTNRNAISRSLYSEYIEELKKRRVHLDKELDYAVAEINACRSAEEEYQEDRERVAQDIRDDDAGFILAAALAVIVPWTINMLGVKEHRENMDYHREYMRKIDNEE